MCSPSSNLGGLTNQLISRLTVEEGIGFAKEGYGLGKEGCDL